MTHEELWDAVLLIQHELSGMADDARRSAGETCDKMGAYHAGMAAALELAVRLLGKPLVMGEGGWEDDEEIDELAGKAAIAFTEMENKRLRARVRELEARPREEVKARVLAHWDYPPGWEHGAYQVMTPEHVMRIRKRNKVRELAKTAAGRSRLGKQAVKPILRILDAEPEGEL